MSPKVCDLGQLEGLADVLWAACIPPGAMGLSESRCPSSWLRARCVTGTFCLLPLQGIASRCPRDAASPDGACCWPPLLAKAGKRSEKSSLSLDNSAGPSGMFADRADQASLAWQEVLTLWMPWTSSQGTRTLAGHHRERAFPFTLLKQIRVAALLLNLFRDIISIREQ